MHRTTTRRTSVLLAAVSSLSLLTTACGGSTDDSGSGGSTTNAKAGEASPNAPLKKGLNVTFLPKQVNTPYFSVADKGGEQALTELGSSYKEVGTNDGADTAGQVTHIDTLTQQGVDAMAVSAQDPEKLCTSLKKAMADGIKIVTYDSDTQPECRDAFVSPAGAEDLALKQLELIGTQTGYKGEIAILSAAKTASNQNTWIDYMKDELADPRYKAMTLVEIAYGDDDADKSYQETQRLLEDHPNLKGIISPTTNGVKAAAKFLSQSSYKGTVALTGLGAPNDMRPYVKDGTVESFVLWDPAKLGELAARAAVALVSGQITGREGQMFLAGDMGWFELGENGIITLGDPAVFDAKNIDNYDF
ncbi:rhamnose ABC transporter substrate-binding protein [Streptomyces ziwulingensis]|uniref:Rhamnose ABC transporter substrate-binding protein n=1 Tax=Streptomyces ziwulingensis TaxID=1045501 RepID=A0ABP9CJ81_9ACTN